MDETVLSHLLTSSLVALLDLFVAAIKCHKHVYAITQMLQGIHCRPLSSQAQKAMGGREGKYLTEQKCSTVFYCSYLEGELTDRGKG